MDPKKNFTEEDHKHLTKYLNLVAKHARFDLDTNELIDYFKSLSFMQQVLLKKVEEHILEVKNVVKVKEPEEKPKPRKTK